MKAQEYVDRYGEKLAHATKEEVITAGAELVSELIVEIDQMIKDRHVCTDAGVMGCIRSQRQKWQAIINKYTAKYGTFPMKKTAFDTSVKAVLGVQCD